MKKTFLALTFGILVFSASAALALTPEQVIADYQAAGYSRVEVRVGPTQIKVEAIRGTEKREVIYDRASGAVIKAETEAVESDDSTRPGVSVRERDRDFVDGADDDDRRDDDDEDDASDDNGGDRDRGDSRSDDDDDNDDSNGRDDSDSDDSDDGDSDDSSGRGGSDD
jgi:hypothetical protein